jgi:hypothetical protein
MTPMNFGFKIWYGDESIPLPSTIIMALNLMKYHEEATLNGIEGLRPSPTTCHLTTICREREINIQGPLHNSL